jgi:SSS family solute:Na+ symporter
LASLILALALKGVINALLFAYTVYTCGLILPVIAGFYKDRLKVTPWGALAAIIGGGSAAVASKLLDIKYLDLGALLISGLLLLVVSLIDRRLKSRKGIPDVTT